MRVAVCIDDFGGMMFNRRRQSRDRELTADLVREAGEGKLRISPFSTELFPADAVTVSADLLVEATEDELCFLEDRALSPHLDRVKELILYRWNRRYPRDLLLDVDPLEAGLRLVEQTEFQGYSHEKITKERYVR